MAPPELQLINFIWNGSPSKLGCIVWFASRTQGWGPPADKQALEFSEPEICRGQSKQACTHTAFNVAKLLSASSVNNQVSFDFDWSDIPKTPIQLETLESLFSQVDKIFLIRLELANGTGHSFVVSSYLNSSQALCCGLYMSYAAGSVPGYTLPEFLKGPSEFAPKGDRDILMSSFTNTFGKLLQPSCSTEEFLKAWNALFGCNPEKDCTQMKEALVKVLDRTLIPPNTMLENIKKQWKQCPHDD